MSPALVTESPISKRSLLLSVPSVLSVSAKSGMETNGPQSWCTCGLPKMIGWALFPQHSLLHFVQGTFLLGSRVLATSHTHPCLSAELTSPCAAVPHVNGATCLFTCVFCGWKIFISEHSRFLFLRFMEADRPWLLQDGSWDRFQELSSSGVCLAVSPVQVLRPARSCRGRGLSPPLPLNCSAMDTSTPCFC